MPQPPPMISYRIDVADVHAHLFHVALTVPRPAASLRVSLPVWIPGSYLVREFARHLSALTASQGESQAPLRQLDKATWLVGCTGDAPLTLRYQVYAFDPSVRAAFLDARRGFFNGTSLLLRVEGREDEPQHLQLGTLPDGWQAATALTPVEVDDAGCGLYEAADYAELVDHPFELGRFWRGTFTAAGVPHEFIVAGALPDFDAERLLRDTQRICEAQIAFWHGPAAGSADAPPYRRYVFLLNAVEDGYGGLEHRASTALIAARRDLPQRGKPETPDAYVTLLGLISHEYFHTWNIKRLRPREFARHDYAAENYTELLWFFEGFTSYYDDLFLVRAGLIDPARFLKLLAKTVTGVLGTPGRKLQSVAQASFDAWIKYYRGDENTPNATVSYYTKGSLVALALDLTLRRGADTQASGSATLDAVMRRLWSHAGPQGQGGPIDEADIAQALAAVAGRTLDDELAAWVHGTGDLPLRGLLEAFGVAWTTQTPTLAQCLGVRVAESALTGIRVTSVLRGGAAERAGLAAGDELIAVDGWRIRRLDEAQRLLATGTATPLLVARDQRVFEVALTCPSPSEGEHAALSVSLAPADQPAAADLARRRAWLGG